MEKADLLPYTYYSDDTSRKIEELLQKDIMLVECRVKRRRMVGDSDSDPFILLDPQGTELVSFDQYELDTLEEPQLLSYIKVRKELRLVENSDEISIIIPIVLVSLFSTLLIVTALFPVMLTNLVFVFILLALPILATISGYFASKRWKSSMFFRKELLVSVFKENPTFLDSLRLLAEKSTTKGWKKKVYRREVQYYEHMISELES